VIVDDSLLVRYRIKHLLSLQNNLTIVGEADNGWDGVQLVQALKPDLVVMDLRMPLMDGVEATLHIKADCPDTVVIGFSSLKDRDVLEQLLRAGAAELVDKSGNWSYLVESVRRSLEGRAVAVH
jgi:DNA-binding NarL/FixJ family response regulator